MTSALVTSPLLGKSVRKGTAEIQTLGYYTLSSLGLALPVPEQANNKVMRLITAIQFQYR